MIPLPFSFPFHLRVHHHLEVGAYPFYHVSVLSLHMHIYALKMLCVSKVGANATIFDTSMCNLTFLLVAKILSYGSMTPAD